MIDPLARRAPAEVEIDVGDIVVLCEGRDECALISFMNDTTGPKLKIGTKTDGLSWEDEFVALAH